MDGYGQIGPEKGSYANDVREVAQSLFHPERAAFVALSDKSTKLRLVLVLRESFALVGQGPEGVDVGEDYIFVGCVEHGAYWFQLGAYHAPDYVASKLGIENADGDTVSEFLTRLAHELTIEKETV